MRTAGVLDTFVIFSYFLHKSTNICIFLSPPSIVSCFWFIPRTKFSFLSLQLFSACGITTAYGRHQFVTSRAPRTNFAASFDGYTDLIYYRYPYCPYCQTRASTHFQIGFPSCLVFLFGLAFLSAKCLSLAHIRLRLHRVTELFHIIEFFEFTIDLRSGQNASKGLSVCLPALLCIRK